MRGVVLNSYNCATQSERDLKWDVNLRKKIKIYIRSAVKTTDSRAMQQPKDLNLSPLTALKKLRARNPILILMRFLQWQNATKILPCAITIARMSVLSAENIPEVTSKDLSRITLEMLSTLNTLSKEKDRMIDIAADGMVSKDEMPDFLRIKDYLDDMSLTIDSLKLWIENTIAAGEIDSGLLKKKL